MHEYIFAFSPLLVNDSMTITGPEPIDPELVKLRRKQLFQKRFYKTRFYIKLLKRKSMASISGWLTRSEYKKKKGHGIK